MTSKIKSFHDLKVWQKAHLFVLEIYKLTKSFPKEELYGVTSQVRRAAVSIPANIVEGFRKRDAEKCRFLNISQGSLEECRYYLILIKDLGYADTDVLNNLLEEISKMLTAYRNSILKLIAK